jgi:hypothetical protein
MSSLEEFVTEKPSWGFVVDSQTRGGGEFEVVRASGLSGNNVQFCSVQVARTSEASSSHVILVFATRENGADVEVARRALQASYPRADTVVISTVGTWRVCVAEGSVASPPALAATAVAIANGTLADTEPVSIEVNSVLHVVTPEFRDSRWRAAVGMSNREDR